MISSAISADLGRQEALQGSQEALATVTGIVDGTGSIGAAGGQVGPETEMLGKQDIFCLISSYISDLRESKTFLAKIIYTWYFKDPSTRRIYLIIYLQKQISIQIMYIIMHIEILH